MSGKDQQRNIQREFTTAIRDLRQELELTVDSLALKEDTIEDSTIQISADGTIIMQAQPKVLENNAQPLDFSRDSDRYEVGMKQVDPVLERLSHQFDSKAGRLDPDPERQLMEGFVKLRARKESEEQKLLAVKKLDGDFGVPIVDDDEGDLEDLDEPGMAKMKNGQLISINRRAQMPLPGDQVYLKQRKPDEFSSEPSEADRIFSEDSNVGKEVAPRKPTTIMGQVLKVPRGTMTCNPDQSNSEVSGEQDIYFTNPELFKKQHKHEVRKTDRHNKYGRSTIDAPFYKVTDNMKKNEKVLDKLLSQKPLNKTALKELAYKGINQTMRKKLWTKVAIDEKNLKRTYTREKYEKHKREPLDEKDQHQILADVKRTFAELEHDCCKGENEAGLHSPLYNVLAAQCNFDKEIGYGQGMSYIAWALLTVLEEEYEAFVALNYVMKDGWNWRSLFQRELAKAQNLLKIVESKLAQEQPQVRDHLTEHNVINDCFILFTDVFMTIGVQFAPYVVAMSIFDIFLLEGERILYRLILNSFQLQRDKILKINDQSDMYAYLKNKMILDCYNEKGLRAIISEV